MITAARFDTGRPVLIVPYIKTGALRLSVMLCRDGSRNVTCAIGDTQLFLACEKAIVTWRPLESFYMNGFRTFAKLSKTPVNV